MDDTHAQGQRPDDPLLAALEAADPADAPDHAEGFAVELAEELDLLNPASSQPDPGVPPDTEAAR